MAENTIVWADVPVADLDRACRFYTAVLGKTVKKESMGGMEFAMLPHFDSNVAGCLVKLPDNQPSQNGPLIYFNVDGRLDDAAKQAGENGGKVLVERHSIGPHGFRAIVLDSEGNRVALHSH